MSLADCSACLFVADAVQLAFVLEIRKDKQGKVERLLRNATEWAQRIVPREHKARGNLVYCLTINQFLAAV